eukprot:TRINITY_DN30548_c0_g1_i1.p2 TRINITY_DN30548_c0_g1~~TRINITY_DN30548_c0_g1_i1.p2  ORF type:complete len:157 (+),score=71.12 TRINITY_DN30548_c0_g1_i1:62-532(+)
MPKPQKTKLRASLSAGTVCILLAGRFRGRRVVMLKQDEKTGTLVVTGPYAINGVPLRRVDPAYVIATSQKINVSKVDTKAVSSAYFARPKRATRKGEEKFFARPEKRDLPAEKKDTQKKVDEQLVKAVKEAGADIAKYLQTPFTLSDRDMPHRMRF